ncbi:MAG: hypothetical protein JW705_01005 [Methanosarcinaceae archaeon]|nr:hypothetical protein [Methanosarcinaceae archaeon]
MKIIKSLLFLTIISMIMMPLATADDGWTDVSDWSPEGGPDQECEQADIICEQADIIVVPGCECNIIADKIETSANGEYGLKYNTVKITNSNGYSFDWESDDPVCKVIVKASTGARIYYYDNPVKGGSAETYGPAISHITFCYCDDDSCEHVFSYMDGDELSGCFAQGSTVTDTITITGYDATTVTIILRDPAGDIFETYDDVNSDKDGKFVVTFTLPKDDLSAEGDWTVEVYDGADTDGHEDENGELEDDDMICSTTFCVSGVPEFIAGSFMALFLVGGIYFVMRHNT